MTSTVSSRKRPDKASSDDAKLTFDLLSNMTYMLAMAAAYTSRDKIFENAATQRYSTTIYFEEVLLLVKKLGFEYSRAFQLVAKKAKAVRVNSLLLRFASSINSGESEEVFLRQEARVQREIYTSEYNRKLDSLQKWSDAYAALLVSISVIVVVAMVSTMLYDAGQGFVVALSLTTIFMSGLGAFIIYSTSPYELKTYRAGAGPKLRRWSVRLFWTLGMLGFLLAAVLSQRSGAGPAFLVLGLFLLPSGICAYLDDQRVGKIDQNLPDFLRALGNVTGTLGSTLTKGLTKIDIRSMGALEPYIVRLRARLNSQLDPDVCWDKFRDETGSELVNRSTRMLVDGVKLGGNAEHVGGLAADYSMNIGLLRSKRYAASQTFAFLSFPMHFAMVGLLVFILQVVEGFNIRLTEIAEFMASQMGSGSGSMPSLPMFEPRDLGLIRQLLTFVIIGFTVANTIAPKFATGGHKSTFAFYGAVISIMSGLCLLLIPGVASKVLV